MRRILFYVHYNKYNDVSEHVLYQLKELRLFYEKIVLISNSILPKEANGIFGGRVDAIIQRENVGYDFAAWRDAIIAEGWAEIEKYDWVTISNDTCFGPVNPLLPMFEKGESSGADFWGITDHAEKTVDKENPHATNNIIPYHISSYFISFSKKCVMHNVFRDFWINLKPQNDVNEVIRLQETQLTPLLSSAELKPFAVYSANEYNLDESRGPGAYMSARKLLTEKNPFIKVKVFELPDKMIPDVEKVITLEKMKSFGYDISIAVSYLIQRGGIDHKYLLNFNLLMNENSNHERKQSLKIAVHIHVFYPDLLEEMLLKLQKSIIDIKLIITTESKLKKDYIECILTNYSYNYEIFIFENSGRDVGPWLKISNILEDYDLVGHFHTKKSREADDGSFGEIWRNEIYRSLLDRLTDVYSAFEKNPRLGMVIPDFPGVFRLYPMVTRFRDDIIFKKMQHVFNNMGSIKKSDFRAKSGLVFPVGTMLWYRPKAIQRLVDYFINLNEFPKEPLPQNSILHVFERLLVYAAWDANYDYSISVAECSSGFIDNISYNSIIERPRIASFSRVKRRLAKVPFILNLYHASRSWLNR